MKTLEELKKQLERAKERQRKLFKEKAASPKEIMAKAKVYGEEIQAIEEEIQNAQRQ